MSKTYLQFISSAPPAWDKGGPTRLSHSYFVIAKQLFNRSFVVCVGDKCDDRSKTATAMGIDNKDVMLTWTLMRGRPFGVALPHALANMINAVRKSNQAVLHLLEFKSTLMLYAVMLKKLFPGRTRLVHSAFGQLSTIDPDRLVLRALCRIYFSSVDVVLCQSKEEEIQIQSLRDRFTRRDVTLRTLPLSVLDAPHHLPGESCHLDRNRFSLPLRAIFLGRVVPEKGILEAMRLLCALPDASRPRSFSIFGPKLDPEYEAQLIDESRAVASNGIVCGRLPVGEPSRRYDHYAAAGLFLMLPTVKEESSLAAIEALITGCKLVINVNCVIPYADLLPTMVFIVSSDMDMGSIDAWLRVPPSVSELQLARKFFVLDGAEAFVQALNWK